MTDQPGTNRKTAVNNLELIEGAQRLASLAGNVRLMESLTPSERKSVMKAIDAAGRRPLTEKYFTLYPDHGKFRRELYYTHLEHYKAGKQFLERAFQGGNRTGKTTCGAFEITAHLTGLYHDWWPGIKFNEPTNCWSAAKKNIKLRDVVQKNLFGGAKKSDGGRYVLKGGGVIPSSAIMHETAIFRQGFPGLVEEIDIRWKDSKYEFSHLGLRSYEQGRGTFEGTSQHFVWCDEEPPMDIYGECLIRLMDVGGRLAVTWTPLDGFTEVVTNFLPAESKPWDAGETTEEYLVEIED